MRETGISIHVTAKVTTKMFGIGKPEKIISIHVTAKVTTNGFTAFLMLFHDFNPRHREGDDSLWIHSGGRQGKHFNPRHREGDDPLARDTRIGVVISIHVTAKVTTGEAVPAPCGIHISIHVTAKVTTYRLEN